MIVHSVTNRLDGFCLVQVEGIEPGMSDVVVRLFAQGAAGGLNKGSRITGSHIVGWLDEDGRPLAEGADTSQGTGARVLCEVVAP